MVFRKAAGWSSLKNGVFMPHETTVSINFSVPEVVPSSNYFVVIVQGQSGTAFMLDADTQYNQVGRLRPAVTGSLGRYIYATDDLPGGLTAGVNLFDVEVTNSTFAHGALAGGRSINRGARAILEFMKFINPTKIPVLVVAAKSGTSMAEMMDDSDIDRYWASFNSLVTYARTNYGEPNIVNFWYGSEEPSDSVDNYPNKRGLLWMGQLRGGGAHTQGTANPDNGDGKIVDHYLFDVTAGNGNVGRGTYRYNIPKIAFPLHPNDQTGVLYRTGVDEVFNDPRLSSMYVGRHFIPSSGHIDPSTDYGQPLQGLMVVGPAALRFAGQTWTPPTITAISEEPTGLWVDVTVNLPNGGNLTTTRALYGEAKIPTPGSPDDAFTSIRGFEFARPGTELGARIEPTRVGSGATTSQMSFSITNSGSGTPPSRTGTVRITPQVPFTSGTLMTYRQGGAASYATLTNPQVNLPFFNHLIEHVPSLVQPSTEFTFPGFEVAGRDSPFTMAVGAPAVPLGGSVMTSGTTPAQPTGLQAGERVMLIASANGTVVMTAPAGWTPHTITGAGPTGSGSQVSFLVCSRVWQAGDTMPSITGAAQVDAHRFSEAFSVGKIVSAYGGPSTAVPAPEITPLTGASARHFISVSSRSGSTFQPTSVSGFTRLTAIGSQDATFYKPDPVTSLPAVTMPAYGATNGGGVITIEIV